MSKALSPTPSFEGTCDARSPANPGRPARRRRSWCGSEGRVGPVGATRPAPVQLSAGRTGRRRPPVLRRRLARARHRHREGDQPVGSADFIGGFGMTALTANNVVIVPIRSGVGFRLGANVGYLKFTPQSTWNPF